jgi:XTP/dITP diphosphohydrolase
MEADGKTCDYGVYDIDWGRPQCRGPLGLAPTESRSQLPRLLLATNNRGKVGEYRDLLAGCGWEIVTPADIGLELDVDESGPDYATNARIKAEAFAEASGLLALADDSGIEVDALGGLPGALSARYAGPDGTDEDRVALVLRQMKGVPPDKRACRFRCVIALVEPAGRVWFTEGECEGLVAETPRGENGFGYDPIFYLPDRGCTIAELPSDEKNATSHRGRAAWKACALLKEMIDGSGNDSRRAGC